MHVLRSAGWAWSALVPQALLQLPQLRSVHIDHVKLPERGADALVTALPRLSELSSLRLPAAWVDVTI
jgi:hypothetical protein